MGFRPNIDAVLYRQSGSNVYGETVYKGAEKVRVGVVHLINKNAKTAIRTDASATHASSFEETNTGTILIPAKYGALTGDRLDVLGQALTIATVEPRISVFGKHDHDQLGVTRLVDDDAG